VIDENDHIALIDESLPVQLTMFDAMKLLDFTNDRLLVSSMDVAERFDKLHKNVIQAIERLECSDEFRRLNFQPSSYAASHGKQQPYYKLTRDGFSLLVMGFTGRKAMYWKERYIQAFNMMEADLLKRSIAAR
jgi:Rha family phage regulatory protein